MTAGWALLMIFLSLSTRNAAILWNPGSRFSMVCTAAEKKMGGLLSTVSPILCSSSNSVKFSTVN